MLANDIVKIIHELAPPKLTERDWDNSGLQLGSLNKEVKKVLIALDISPLTLNYAIMNNVDMIISHHPLFFKSIKSISADDIKGKMIVDLIKHDIIVYSIHTNLDSAENGINEVLANKFKLLNTQILSKSYTEKLYKVAVYVPETHSDVVRKAMTDNGGGFIGNYSHCTFNTEGTGTFMPREGTNPFIGDINKMEYVKEAKIETIVGEERLGDLIKSMCEVHPYEEVAYDIYNVSNEGKQYGYGRIGELESEKTLYDMALLTKETLCCDSVKVYGDPDKIIKRVAICGGSGIDFLKDAYLKKADVYITGDIKYHDAQIALEQGIALIDAGHFYTEKIILSYIGDFLNKKFNADIDILVYDKKSIPFMTI